MPKLRTTIETLTIHQILTLRQEAAKAGDFDLAVFCTRAISGHQSAAEKVVEAIRAEELRVVEDAELQF